MMINRVCEHQNLLSL